MTMTKLTSEGALQPLRAVEIIEAPAPPDAGEPVAMVIGDTLRHYVGSDHVLRLPETLTFAEWDALGTMLQRASDTLEESTAMIRLWRADWWRFGMRRYGEDHATHAREMWGVTGKTIANDAAGTSRVAPEARQVAGVTFGQLEAVNGLPEPEQQVSILKIAVEGGLSKSETERLASGKDEATWERERALRALRLAYHRLDPAGRAEAHAWFAGLIERVEIARGNP